MYTCIYIYIYIYIYICLHICMHKLTNTYIHIFVYIYIYIYIYKYIYVCMYICMYIHIYIQAYMYINVLMIVYMFSYSLCFNIVNFIYNALMVPFQQLLQCPMEVLLCERVSDLRHSLFHLLNCLITTTSELRELPKVTGSKVWTIGSLRNCVDAHLGQIVCDKDGDVDWCIVQVEMSLTRFEECWPLP